MGRILWRVIMNINKVLCALFALAAGCFIAGTFNHIMSTGEGIVSSILLAIGCLFMAHSFYNKSKK